MPPLQLISETLEIRLRACRHPVAETHLPAIRSRQGPQQLLAPLAPPQRRQMYLQALLIFLRLRLLQYPVEPDRIHPDQRLLRIRVCQMPQHPTESAGCFASRRRDPQQRVRTRNPRLVQRLHHRRTTRIRRHQDSHCRLDVFGQPTLRRGDEALQFLIRRFAAELEDHPAQLVGRIRLRIARRRRLDVGQAQGGAHLFDRVLIARPADQLVRQPDDRPPRPPRVRQVVLGVRLRQEGAQVFRMGRREGLVDRLIWIPYPHPVAVRSN